MKERILLIVVLVVIVNVKAQEKRLIIDGIVQNDSLAVSDIHIFNKNTNKGSVTDNDGRFSIEAKLKDTVFFSGIQFYTKIIVIKDVHIKKKSISVELILDTNELDEVFIKNKLSGNLFLDAGKQKVTESKIVASALDFTLRVSNKPYEITDEDKRFTSGNDELPLFLGGRGGSIIELVGLVVNPLAKLIRESKADKRAVKKKERIFRRKVRAALGKIREGFGDMFFIETLKIPKIHINLFIDFCESKKIGALYISGKRIELIEVFIKESKVYRGNNNLN